MRPKHACRYCKMHFTNEKALEVHELYEAHCAVCGESHGERLTTENADKLCQGCEAELEMSKTYVDDGSEYWS